ncbi:MAG: sugar phosphate isomerase/epimerase [Bacteroidales bacterium]|jgi:sugar phosphate isomerase/epimerase|nr:sugar phosphate isomerase/epimerase [Bacteroidales bacterium]
MKKLFLAGFAVLLFAACSSKCGEKNRELPGKDISLQLYSLRDDISKNFDSTINLAAAAGYTSIEAASYGNGKFYGKTPEEFKKAIEDAGMQVLSSHVCRGLDSVEVAHHDFTAALAWWDTTIMAHEAAGMKYIVSPCFGIAHATANNMKVWCDYLNEVGKKCAEHGIQYGYHNHAGEFTLMKDSNMKIYDYMLENTNPDLVFFQMDIYWAIIGDCSPVEYFNKYPGRFKMLHVKDYKELGQSGMVGFDAIFKNTDVAGVQQLVVEVEQYNYSPGESVKMSLDYLRECPWVKEKYEK